MKKLKSLLLFLMLMMLFLSGCGIQSQSINLAVCGSYAVPGMFCQDLKGGTFQCEVLETDSKGRVLFTYTAYNVITSRNEQAAVICQAIDRNNVYFYEDICYFLGHPSNEQLETMKKNNDWEKELDYSRMAKRSNETSLDLNIISKTELNIKKVIALCAEKLLLPSTNSCELLLVDENQTGQVMYLLKSNAEKREKKYLVLVNDEYEVCCVAIEGKAEDLKLLPLIKSKCSWYS